MLALIGGLLIGISLQSANFVFNGFLSPILSLMHGGVVTLLTLATRPAVTSPRTVNLWRVSTPSLCRPGYAP